MDFYIGTYTRDTSSEGIYRLSMYDDEVSLDLVSRADNPSWLVRDENRKSVFAVAEVNSGDGTGGALEVFRENRQLEPLQSVTSNGDDPCHLLLDDDLLVVTNYSSGSVTLFEVSDEGFLTQITFQQHEGSGPDTRRQETAHAHSSIVVNGEIVVADLGADRLVIYDRSLLRCGEVTVARGAGPRLMALNPASPHLYVICELSNTIETYEISGSESRHAFRHIGSVSTLPEDFDGESFTAHLEISVDGRFLYGSNRGHDSLVVMAIEDGLPQPVQWVPSGGRHPRHFTMSRDETVLLIANRDDNNIVLYGRDGDSGLLSDLDREVKVPAPVCIVPY